jgi:hypothetical protein
MPHPAAPYPYPYPQQYQHNPPYPPGPQQYPPQPGPQHFKPQPDEEVIKEEVAEVVAMETGVQQELAELKQEVATLMQYIYHNLPAAPQN